MCEHPRWLQQIQSCFFLEPISSFWTVPLPLVGFNLLCLDCNLGGSIFSKCAETQQKQKLNVDTGCLLTFPLVPIFLGKLALEVFFRLVFHLYPECSVSCAENWINSIPAGWLSNHSPAWLLLWHLYCHRSSTNPSLQAGTKSSFN